MTGVSGSERGVFRKGVYKNLELLFLDFKKCDASKEICVEGRLEEESLCLIYSYLIILKSNPQKRPLRWLVVASITTASPLPIPVAARMYTM